MLNEESKIKIDSLTIKELGENLAFSYYGAMDSEKSRYAQHVLEMKKREENDDRILALIGSIGNLANSNEKTAKSQGQLTFWQVVLAGALTLATFGLIYVTWIK
ncbi:MAG: hypothetical protein WC632_05940 [Candidatus Margulisiibacteriota bacterium]